MWRAPFPHPRCKTPSCASSVASRKGGRFSALQYLARAPRDSRKVLSGSSTHSRGDYSRGEACEAYQLGRALQQPELPDHNPVDSVSDSETVKCKALTIDCKGLCSSRSFSLYTDSHTLTQSHTFRAPELQTSQSLSVTVDTVE